MIYDSSALLERLTNGIDRSGQSVSMLLGSAITAPATPGDPGVPGVAQMLDMIRAEFEDPKQILELDEILLGTENAYQAAFSFLLGRRGQRAANEIVKQAVWRARKQIQITDERAPYAPSATTSDEACKALELDIDGWALSPAVAAVGSLAAHYPKQFGRTVLTTNFDPLIETAISVSGGQFFRTTLHRDGNLNQTTGEGTHVAHLHGYWYGSDTLHTPRQLLQKRPQLKASLAHLISGQVVVVSGYSGWDDIFTQALIDVTLDDNAFPEIIWTFLEAPDEIPSRLLDSLSAGIDRGRVSLYAGVNCHVVFPELLNSWLRDSPPEARTAPRRTRSLFAIKATPPPSSAETKAQNASPQALFERGEQDRPPLVDFYVGRSEDLEILQQSPFTIGFVTGIGGQGKSALAARYFATARANQSYDHYIWRDCKEESDRFETQVISIVEALGDNPTNGTELPRQSMDSLADLFVLFSKGRRLLIVFDNVDHYVDLEEDKLLGAPAAFVERLLNNQTDSRIIFTCRPTVRDTTAGVLTRRLEGLDLESTIELFAARGASATHGEIAQAHELTNGHAFWLDLLAAQVAKHPHVELADLLHPLSATGSEIPVKTLQSIWATLREREQMVLRALAETVRPTSEAQLADYLFDKIRYNQIVKALRYLRSLNLLVIKPQSNDRDTIELHPLVREFIRRTFPPADRRSFIDGILKVYLVFFGHHKTELRLVTTLSTLQNWTEATELYISAEKYEEAFGLMSEVRVAFTASDCPGEFARVAAMLFGKIDWDKYKDYKDFDRVVDTYSDILANTGRTEDCRRLLASYRETITARDARYVHYCSMNCYLEWVLGEFKEAIRWGTEGRAIKAKGGLDTAYDTAHNLALAQRDAGLIDPALEYFLGGRTIEEVLDPDELDEARGGAHYGNIGRCLHMMGQIGPALVCYKKSAITLEMTGVQQHVSNQAYIRQWIGELLVAREEYCEAIYFFQASLQKWMAVAPPRAEKLADRLGALTLSQKDCKVLSPEDAERFCVAWIYEREAEFV